MRLNNVQKDLVEKIKFGSKKKKNNHKKLFIVNLHTRHVSLYSSLYFSFSLFVFSQANSCAQGSRHFFYVLLSNRNKMYHNFVNTIFVFVIIKKADLLLEKVYTKIMTEEHTP